MSEVKPDALIIRPETFAEAKEMALDVAKSSLLARAMQGKAPDVLVTILAGQELGLAPMAALRGIHVVQGRPVLSADLMSGVVLASGKAEYFRKVFSDATRATYETKRKGDSEPQRASFTIEEAKQANLTNKGNWKSYPAAMLRARAKAILARDAYPDVLAGVYTADEIDDLDELSPRTGYSPPPVRTAPASNEADTDVIDADVVETSEMSEADKLSALADELRDEIEAHDFAAEPELPAVLVDRLLALPENSDERRELRDLYTARSTAAREATA